MKKLLLNAFCYFTVQAGTAQFGVSIHQSNLPFAGFNYQIGERFLPEFRIGTDQFFEDLSLEMAVNYIFKKDEVVNAYAGLGVRANSFTGIVLPVGLNIYPFASKKFGFQMELAAIAGESDPLLRGSWGIRYRFLKE